MLQCIITTVPYYSTYSGDKVLVLHHINISFFIIQNSVWEPNSQHRQSTSLLQFGLMLSPTHCLSPIRDARERAKLFFYVRVFHHSFIILPYCSPYSVDKALDIVGPRWATWKSTTPYLNCSAIIKHSEFDSVHIDRAKICDSISAPLACHAHAQTNYDLID